jgi:GTPase SAR1 family protein
MSNIEYILNCFLKSEEGFAGEIKDNIDDYDNIFSEYVIPFLIPREVNIVLIGMSNTGKTSFIKSLGGELKEDNIDYSLYEIYIHDILINMYEFSSKNMYKNMTKKYDNIDGIILMVDTESVSYFYGLTWFQEMYKRNGNIPYIFLRNKIDNLYESTFDSLYHTWNISAKNKYGIEESIQNLLKKIN